MDISLNTEPQEPFNENGNLSQGFHSQYEGFENHDGPWHKAIGVNGAMGPQVKTRVLLLV